MPIYRPRMTATLKVPVMGTRQQRINQAASTKAIDLTIRPKRVRIESNNHQQADSCTLTADWLEVGVDPRLLDNAVIQVFIDNADDYGLWDATDKNCRFIGLVKDVSASRSSDAAAEVVFECVDYTSLFLTAKPFGSSGIPKYTQRLDEAWRTIVSQTPGAGMLADRLVKEGFDEWPLLSTAVAERFAKFGFVPTKPGTDAWAVWMQCVGMMGLISYIDQDRCIVTTATNYFSEDDSPILMWGQNIEEWGESRHSEISRKGVGVTSYNALTRTSLEALFPPVGDERIDRKRATAVKKLSEELQRAREEREYFPCPGITDPVALLAKAKCIYEQRSRQELEGRVRTREMFIGTERGNAFDMLRLKAGDSVKVLIEAKSRQLLAELSSAEARREFLKVRGYSDDAATLIIANMSDFASLEAKFLVKSAVTEFEVSEEGGSFSVEFDYINRIQIDGSATQ